MDSQETVDDLKQTISTLLLENQLLRDQLSELQFQLCSLHDREYDC